MSNHGDIKQADRSNTPKDEDVGYFLTLSNQILISRGRTPPVKPAFKEGDPVPDIELTDDEISWFFSTVVIPAYLLVAEKLDRSLAMRVETREEDIIFVAGLDDIYRFRFEASVDNNRRRFLLQMIYWQAIHTTGEAEVGEIQNVVKDIPLFLCGLVTREEIIQAITERFGHRERFNKELIGLFKSSGKSPRNH